MHSPVWSCIMFARCRVLLLPASTHLGFEWIWMSSLWPVKFRSCILTLHLIIITRESFTFRINPKQRSLSCYHSFLWSVDVARCLILLRVFGISCNTSTTSCHIINFLVIRWCHQMSGVFTYTFLVVFLNLLQWYGSVFGVIPCQVGFCNVYHVRRVQYEFFFHDSHSYFETFNISQNADIRPSKIRFQNASLARDPNNASALHKQDAFSQ